MSLSATKLARNVPGACKTPPRDEANFRTLVDAIATPIFISYGGALHYVNHAAELITGYLREELFSMNFWDLVSPEDREPAGLPSQREVRIITKNQEERWLEISATVVDFDGETATLISAFDLTERKRLEAQTHLLAVTDALTGLGNYRRLVDVLQAEIERSGRTGRSFAILLLDLDGLKKINDRYGHLVGSQALCRVANVLRVFGRSIDTAARYGGDEFAVILPEIVTPNAARVVASRICGRLAQDGLEPRLSASVGVAVCPQDGETVEALLREADRELYAMKCRGVETASLLTAT
jgi:diguanylate cyclase (GGDEF)-like protein/PAS domain S-box-containing protein